MPRVRLPFAGKALLAVVLALALSAVAGASIKSGNYGGKTAQKQKLTFTVSGGKVKHLKFVIDDRCPDGHVLHVTDSGFPDMPIGRKGHFGGTFGPDTTQPTTVHGTVSGKNATGSITDTSLSTREHKFCHGHTTFGASTK
jgi:hypothetical protein